MNRCCTVRKLAMCCFISIETLLSYLFASCRQVTKNGECDSGWKQASSGTDIQQHTASENVFHAEVLHYLARSKWPVRGRVSQQPMEFISIPYTTRASARSFLATWHHHQTVRNEILSTSKTFHPQFGSVSTIAPTRSPSHNHPQTAGWKQVVCRWLRFLHEAYGGKHAQRPVRLPSTAGVAGEFSGRCNVARGNKQTVVAVVLRLPPVGLCPLRVEIYVLICFAQWLCCVFPAKAVLGRLFEGPDALAGSPRGCLCVAIGVLVAWGRVRFNQIINEWNKLSLMVCGARRRIIPLFGLCTGFELA